MSEKKITLDLRDLQFGGEIQVCKEKHWEIEFVETFESYIEGMTITILLKNKQIKEILKKINKINDKITRKE